MNVITDSTVEPVTLSDVKTRIGITDQLSDAEITAKIKQARNYVENYLRRSLIEKTLEIRMNYFSQKIELPAPPTLSIVSVKYINGDGVLTTVSSGDYVLDDSNDVAFVRPVYGSVWPFPRPEENACRIQYKAGYGTAAANVPPTIIECIYEILNHWINYSRQGQDGINQSRIPYAIRDQLDPHAVIRYANAC